MRSAPSNFTLITSLRHVLYLTILASMLTLGMKKRPVRDTVANNACAKFDALLSKKYDKLLEDFSEEAYRELESLKDTFEDLDDLIPLDDEEEIEMPKRRKRQV